jgi:phycobilisome core component
VRGIQIMKEMLKDMAIEAGLANIDLIDAPFDHLAQEFSDVSV